jgi:hypothetical protein
VSRPENGLPGFLEYSAKNEKSSKLVVSSKSILRNVDLTLGGSFLSDAADSIDNIKQKKASAPASLRFIHAADFFQEISSFWRQTDVRLMLSNVLKERGLSEDVHALSSLTDPDIDTILADACRLFADGEEGEGA